MAIVKAILQPLGGGAVHSTEVLRLLGISGADLVRISTAFVNRAGVRSLVTALEKNKAKSRCFIGIRNGASTIQGVIELLKLGIETYVVDTATRARIFHPKIYAVRKGKKAAVIIGSANSTHAGLHNNIEASALVELDLHQPSDADFFDKLIAPIDALPSSHPEHCYRVESVRHAVRLMWDGLLEDERNPKVTSSVGVASGTKFSPALSPIGLPFIAPPREPKSKKPKAPIAAAAKGPSAGMPVGASVTYGELLWEKPNLHKTDLQLLTQGHVPGVLRLTKARYKIAGALIDQMTYFRYTVFGSLSWKKDLTDPNKEMSAAKFALVLGGVLVGIFRLDIVHKPAWEAGQHNYVTGIHWGNAKTHISQPGLLGRTLRLYAPAIKKAPYVIEID